MPLQSRTGFDAFGNKIVNVATATLGTDVPNLAQIQALFQGVAWKTPVRAVATANITLSGTQTVDGIALAVGDRVLVTAQTTGSQNGLWIVSASAWTRPADSTGTNLSNGDVVESMAGGTAVPAGALWRLTTPNPITPDTTTQTWSMVPNATGQTYTAGAGLSLAGSTFAANADGTSLTADGTSLRINPSYSGLAKRYASTLPAIAAGASATITHGLGTTDLDISFQDITGTPYPVSYDVTNVTTTQLTVTNGSTALAASSARIIVQA